MQLKQVAETMRLKKLYWLLIFVWVYILVSPIFGDSSPFITKDQPTWTAIAYVLHDEIVPNQKWFWSVITDREHGGLVLGDSYSLNLILLWLFTLFASAAFSVKLLTLLNIFLFGFFFYIFMLNFVKPKYAFMASLMAISATFINSMYGMSYANLSIGFGLMFWYFMNKFVEGYSLRHYFGCIVFLTLSLYGHPLGFLPSLIIWALMFIRNLFVKPSNFYRSVIIASSIPCISFLFSAPQLISILNNLSFTDGIYQSSILMVPVSLKELILYSMGRGILNVPNSLRLFGYSFALVGAFYFFRKKDFNKYIFLLLFVFFLLVASKYIVYSPIRLPMISGLVRYNYRFLLWLNLLWIILMVIGIHNFETRILPIIKTNLNKLVYLFATLFFIILIFFLNYSSMIKTFSYGVKLSKTLNMVSEKKDLMNLWTWINTSVDPNVTRILFEGSHASNFFNNLDNNFKSHILALTSIYTDVKQMGGWCGYSSNFAFRYSASERGYLFGTFYKTKFDYNVVLENLKLLNSQFIVVNSNEIISFVSKIPALEHIKNFGKFAIFKYSSLRPQWAYNVEGNSAVSFYHTSPVELKIKTIGQKGDTIHLSFPYDKAWKATIDNTVIPILNYNELMRIQLPSNGEHTITFNFMQPKRLSTLFVTLGFFFFTLICLLLFRIKR